MSDNTEIPENTGIAREPAGGPNNLVDGRIDMLSAQIERLLNEVAMLRQERSQPVGINTLPQSLGNVGGANMVATGLGPHVRSNDPGVANTPVGSQGDSQHLEDFDNNDVNMQLEVTASRGGREVRYGVRGLDFQHGIGANSSAPAVQGIPTLIKEGAPIQNRSAMPSKEKRQKADPVKPETLKITKFDGTDYNLWKKGMLLYLKSAKLLWVVLWVGPMPQDPNDMEDWDDANTKASNIIFQALTKDQQQNVQDCETAADMWRVLEDSYMRKSAVNQAHLIEEYEGFYMKKGVSMQKYISDLKTYISKLRGVGVEYVEKSKVLKLLRGLGADYEMDRKI